MQATITIKGREYQVTAGPDAERLPYLLTGARGAIYGTMRHLARADRLFLVSAHGRGVNPLGDVWLTDERGHLEVV